MNVKELRQKKNLTQEELSAKSGIPRDRIAKWEQGKGKPKAEDEKILLGILGEDIPNTPVSEIEPHIGIRDNTNALLETINLLVRQNDKLADTNRILAEKITTIPVNDRSETQQAVESMLQGLREFVLKVSLENAVRYKSLEEARSAYRREVGGFVPKSKLKDIQNG